MPIEHIHSFLVHPSKAAQEQPRIGGTSVGLEGRLFDMLAGVYQKSEKECNIDISFNANERGEQQNDCRDAFLHYIGHPNLVSGRAIAQRLQIITTNRSGLGLLCEQLAGCRRSPDGAAAKSGMGGVTIPALRSAPCGLQLPDRRIP